MENRIGVKNRKSKKTEENIMQDSIAASERFLYLGVKSSDTITICMPNCYEAMVCSFAASRIGAAVTFLNDMLPEDEVRQYLKQAHSPLLINYAKSAQDNAALIRETDTKYVLTLRPQDTVEQMQKEKISYGDLFTPVSLPRRRGNRGTVQEIKQRFFSKKDA